MQLRGRIQDMACLALLALAVLAFFWPLFLTETWIPRGGGDLVSFLWPMYHFAARYVRSGTVPLWNPHLHSGAPFVADNQSGLFYPVNLLTFAIFGPPSYAVMEGLVLLHVWLAAAAMFGLLRGLRLRRAPALTGGLAFAFSDLFVTHVGNLNLNATAAWLPVMLWLTHRALERRSPTWAGAAGAVLSVAALAGHGQILLFAGMTLGLYVLYRVATIVALPSEPAARDRRWQRAGKVLGVALIIAAVGFGGAALTLLPAYQMAGHTGRGHLSYQEATRYSLPPRALVGLLAPGFYGRGPANFWGPWDRVEVGYAGVPTLALAGFAVTVCVSRWRPGRSCSTPQESQPKSGDYFPFAFFALLIPLAFVLAMGQYTPLYRLLYRLVPTFDQLRAPARLIVLADMGMAALAAYGLDQLVRNHRCCGRAATWIGVGTGVAAILALILLLPQARALPPPDRVRPAIRSIIIATALLAMCGLLISITRGRSWMGWLFPFLLAVDLIGLGSTVEIEPNDPTLGFQHADIVAFLRQDPSLFRIEDSASAWQPDAALMHGLYDVGGVYNPLGLAPYQAYRWAVGARGAPLYNLLGVKYVLADKGAPPGDERLVKVYDIAPEIDVYLNTAALPRALFVPCQRIVRDHEEAWQAIHAPTFDPTRIIVLEQEQLQDTVVPLDCVSATGGSHISFVHYHVNTIKLVVKSPVDSWLLLSDVYYPGWQAKIDGTQARVVRADYAFRAVKVPAGDHVVQMSFAPWTWRAGLALSLCTWLGLAAGAALKFRSLYGAPASPEPPRRTSC